MWFVYLETGPCGLAPAGLELHPPASASECRNYGYVSPYLVLKALFGSFSPCFAHLTSLSHWQIPLVPNPVCDTQVS